MDDFGSIFNIVTNWADEIGSYALALMAVGTLSMALLEAFKGIFKLRASYHERSLKHWLRKELKQYLDPERLSSFDLPKEDAFSITELANDGVSQVVSLATGVPVKRINSQAKPYSRIVISPERSLYTLPLEKMMGQIQESAEIILDNPHLYRAAFFLLTSTANQGDVKNWYQYRSPNNMPDDKVSPQEMARVGNRIQQSVQRQLDTFQLKTDYLWSRRNQLGSFIIGAIVLFYAIYYNRSLSDAFDYRGELPEILVLSLFGGFVAPVAKDLVTSLRKVKIRE